MNLIISFVNYLHSLAIKKEMIIMMLMVSDYFIFEIKKGSCNNNNNNNKIKLILKTLKNMKLFFFKVIRATIITDIKLNKIKSKLAIFF